MLSVQGLTKRYGGQMAVDSLSLDAIPGDIIGLVGANSAGKTTSMRMIAGVLEPDSGSVRVNGFDMWTERLSAQQHLGYLPEGAPLWGELTPRETLSFFADARGLRGTGRKAALASATDATEIGHVLNKPVSELSKGMRRRVSLAATLLHDPLLLVLDEPTDGLDPHQKRRVRGLFEKLASDRVIIISTHLLEEVEAVCNRAIVISHGKKLADETPQEFALRSPKRRFDDAFFALTAQTNNPV
jgi:ABC-2 type transport system ATP-binding protein